MIIVGDAHDAARERLRVRLACTRNEATHAFADGSVSIRGVDLDLVSIPAEETFRRVLHDGEFEAAEMSLAECLLRHGRGDRELVPLPVVTARAFRHAMLWVRDDDPIRTPADLAGRRIGIRRYASTALVYLRGMLNEEHGLLPEQVVWVQTGRDDPVVSIPTSVSLEQASPDADLYDLLVSRALGAVADFWSLDHTGRARGVRRLFADVRDTEADYFRRTGIVPIMHIVVLRRSVYDAHPWLAASIALAFQAASDHARDRIRVMGQPGLSASPWAYLDVEYAAALMGDSPFRHGLEPNRTSLEAAARFVHEQGLTASRIRPEDLFAPEAVAALASGGGHSS